MLLLLNLFSSIEILDKLDRYSHLSINKNSLLFVYSLGFVDFIDAKFREAYLPFAFISKIVSFPWNIPISMLFSFSKIKNFVTFTQLVIFECRDLG